MLYHFPNYYQDYSQTVTIAELRPDKIQTIKVYVDKFANVRLKSKRVKNMQKATVSDESGKIEVVWFNQPFLENIIKENSEIYLAGKLNDSSKKPQLLSPDYESVKSEGGETTHVGRITPIYSLTEGIKQKWLRTKAKWLVEYLDYISDLNEPYPEDFRAKFEIIDLKTALKDIHFPKNSEKLEQSRGRLGFDEMLKIQLILEKQREKRKLEKAPQIILDNSDPIKEFVENLPFELTEDQNRSIQTIKADLEKELPMYRLLQGDVGTGKTVVAIAAAKAAIATGLDAVIMAPTTVLAKQLYDEFSKHISSKIDFYSSKTRQTNTDLFSKTTKTEAKQGQILIGTHSLLHLDDNQFDNLGVLIIDEQHRFGVKQRAKIRELKNKHGRPHTLLMTATPIPRTLARTVFGDIEVSVIKTKPKTRKPVKTHLVPHAKLKDGYKWIENKIKNENEQVFWICPLIEESDVLETKSVEATFKQLKKVFPRLKIEQLHGKLKPADKNNLLDDFKNQKFDILVSTSVIEVGIDIPNANVIVIEGAERFGMAQLHQLRGRVGRGDKQSFCFLFTSDENSVSDEAVNRLKYFASETDGLKIAEFDLQRRGPGEVYGIKQSGIPNFKIASITDTELIQKTQQAAKFLLSDKNK